MACIESEGDMAEPSERGDMRDDGASADGGANASLAARVFSPMIAAGAASYRRARDLPKLMALAPEALEDDSIETAAAIVTRLSALARAQHRLGRRRHWSYDMNRHLAVLIALKAERAHLAHRRNAGSLARLIADAAKPQGGPAPKAEPEAA